MRSAQRSWRVASLTDINYNTLFTYLITYLISYLCGSDRDEERKHIGERSRQLREEKGFEAKQLAVLAKIDAANLSRIEQGRYSVGLDILTKISDVLGAKIDIVIN